LRAHRETVWKNVVLNFLGDRDYLTAMTCDKVDELLLSLDLKILDFIDG